MKEYLKFRKSFTLIELLVVIAIIALLSSVILVNLSGPRQKARITRSLEFSQSVQHAIGNEAVGVWDFDEGSGTLVKDASGYANNGTLYNFVSPNGWTTSTPYAVVGSGQGKYALSFDGADDYIDYGNGSNLNMGLNDWTVAVWVKFGNKITQQNFIAKGGGVGRWWLVYFSNSVSANFYNGAGYDYWTSNSRTVNDGMWHYIVWTVDRDASQYIYLDGKLEVGPSSVSSAVSQNVTNSSSLVVGQLTNYFDGSIDEVRIYATALTLGQIQDLYLAGLEKHQQLTMD